MGHLAVRMSRSESSSPRAGKEQDAGRCGCRWDQSLPWNQVPGIATQVITLRDVYLRFTCIWDGHPDVDWSGGGCHLRALMGLSDLFPTSNARRYFCPFHHIRRQHGMDRLRKRVTRWSGRTRMAGEGFV